MQKKVQKSLNKMKKVVNAKQKYETFKKTYSKIVSKKMKEL